LNSYVGQIRWNQRFYVKYLIKHNPNNRSLYRFITEKLELEILKRK